MDDTEKNEANTPESGEKKEGPRDDAGDPFMPPEPTFRFFITTLALQASIFLGDMPSPVNNKTEKNLQQAKFIIDTMSMLKEKTRNNLDENERTLLESVLYELQLRYVAVSGGGNK